MTMAKKKQSKTTKTKTIEFTSKEAATVTSSTSPVSVESRSAIKTPALTPAEIDFVSRSPAFKELALPKLPELEKQNRARLLVQSPNRVFFYWSLRSNPFQALHRSLDTDTAGFTLVLRLIDIESEREELKPIEPEGTHWFHTEAGRSYRAEIGFYSTTRPFIRILFSNTITTPRRSPSQRAATESDWRVTSHKFAEVLDVSGFQKDAFDVAITGDEPAIADAATRRAFEQLTGDTRPLENTPAEDIRFALLAMASGRAVEQLKWRIGAELYNILQANADRFETERAAAAVKEHFQIDEVEFEEDEIAATVFGSSAVNFPHRFKTSGYSPLSSSRLR